MATFFLSYSRFDAASAQQIQTALEAQSLSCWRDIVSQHAGDDFAVEITAAIRECDAFILLLSPNLSDYVCKEIAIAYHFKKRIIPILVEQCTIPDCALPYVVRINYWDSTVRSIEDFARDLARQFPPATSVTASISHQEPEVVVSSPSYDRQNQQNSPATSIDWVTNNDYLKFVRNTRRRRPLHWDDSDPHFPPDQSRDPVTWVSWDDALAYCDWNGGCLPGNTSQIATVATHDSLEDGGIGEWRNAGTEDYKQVCDPLTSQLIALMDHETSRRNISFRCLAAQPHPNGQRIGIGGGNYQIGTDVPVFSRIADQARLPGYVRNPILARPAAQMRIPDFSIAAACVTNEEFFQFTRTVGHSWPIGWDAKWLGLYERPFPLRLATLPVVNVTAIQAQAYCAWKNAHLPMWFQWERAAAGPQRQLYPWGTDYNPAYCNSLESGHGALADVNEYPEGNSREGVQQLCGNVWEWVTGAQGTFEVRGGSYRTSCQLWGMAYTFWQPNNGHYASDIGFRVVY